MLLSTWTTVGWAQTPQLNFTLTTNESGVTKKYEARESIILGNGFRYAASTGYSFIARINKSIDIALPNGNVLKPDGTQIKPDGTVIAIDGTQTKPDGTIIMPDGTVYKTNGTIINPDGTLLDISLIVPEIWFKTIPITTDVNGRYKWKDFSTNNVPLVRYSTNGATNEYTVGRDSVMHYNFNPAIDLTAGNISKEIIIGKSNLAQATIMGVWGTKKEINNTDKFIFALNGRRNESIVFSKSKIFSSVESGKNALSYGNDSIKNLLALPNSTTTANKARASSLRIASYYQSNMPTTSVWGEQQKATISLGNSFQNANINNTSTFTSTLNNFERFKGYTPELLVFSKVLQPVERSVFESYLAIKYGVSLDKSYYSGKGKVIWDYKLNSPYNNRITGYGREDILALNQKMATTSYQEAPYFSDSCDSYMANSANTLSSPRRLLVMGCQADTPLNDGEYILFGDDNHPITDTNISIPGYITMQRKWLININTNRNIKNWIELSYFDSLAVGFAAHKYDTYLLIDRTGVGEFNSSSEFHLMNSFDATRSKIIFNNVYWKSGDVFTFGYKTIAQQGAKKKEEEVIESNDRFVDDISVYYNDPANHSNITVRVETAQSSPAIIMVYDMSGRRMNRITLPEGCEARYANLHIETQGIYIVKVTTNDKEYSRKVIVN